MTLSELNQAVYDMENSLDNMYRVYEHTGGYVNHEDPLKRKIEEFKQRIQFLQSECRDEKQSKNSSENTKDDSEESEEEEDSEKNEEEDSVKNEDYTNKNEESIKETRE